MPSAQAEPKAGEERATGIYVYGIVPGDVELNSGVQGVGDPPGEIRLVRSGDLAALVSDVNIANPLGTPEDLQAHQQILDATVADAPVLPSRFGAVLTSEEAVAEELLDANHDEFAAALQKLEGLAEYIVRGRYVEQAILAEVLSENSQAARLQERIRGVNPEAARELRIQLGEIINNAVASKRKADTDLLMSELRDHSAMSTVRSATSELDAAYVAFLVEAGKAGELKRAVQDLGDRWEGRVELHVRGPMAPYDFVGAGG